MIHGPKIYKRICSCAPHSANLKEEIYRIDIVPI